MRKSSRNQVEKNRQSEQDPEDERKNKSGKGKGICLKDLMVDQRVGMRSNEKVFNCQIAKEITKQPSERSNAGG